MANPSVEKLKDLALRHGEKVFVAGAAAMSLWFISEAFRGPEPTVTPEQLKETAARASKNVKRPLNREELAKQMAQEFLKFPDLGKKVEDVANHEPLPVDNLQPLAALDPTGGILRDRPVLIAPEDLNAKPGRGGTLVYLREPDTGEFIYAAEETPELTKPARPATRRKGGKNSPRGGAPGFAMGGPAAEPTPEEKKAADRQRARQNQAIVGSAGDADKDAKDKEADEPVDDGRRPKEVIKGFRWVAITGLFNNQKQREAYAKALKLDPTAAYPAYESLELDRQELKPDGTWSDWERVDREANRKILEDVPEIDHELTLDEARLKPLVDDLPFLKIGIWRGVHHASLLTPEAIESIKPKAPVGARGPGGMMPGGMNPMAMMAAMAGRGGGPGRGTTTPPPGGMNPMATMAMMNSRGGMGAAGLGGAGSLEDTNYPRTEAERIMVRALDFTVVPEATYRYRSRVVVRNPNLERDDLNLGVDSTAKVLEGPWSEPTGTVTIPPDVSTFALAKAPPTPIGRGEEVEFQVARWNEDDGQTVVKTFPAAPGQVIGELVGARVPDPKGVDKPHDKKVNFVSRYLLLDTEGGNHPVSQQLGLPPGPDLEAPALAVILRPDGSVVVRNGARDARDPEPREDKDDYNESLKEGDSNTKRMPAGMNAMSSFGGMQIPKNMLKKMRGGR